MTGPSAHRLFGAVERRLFRVTATLLMSVVLIGLVAVLFWTLGIVLSFFYNLVIALSLAGILALVLYPVVDFLEHRLRLNRLAATLAVVLLFVGSLAGAIVILVPPLIREVGIFAEMVPPILARWEDKLVTYWPDMARMLKDSAQADEVKEVMPGLERTGRTVWSVSGFLVAISFVPLLLFFALLSGRHLHGKIADLLSVFNTRTQKKTQYFIRVFLDQVTGFFQGQLVIAAIMGALFALGFSLIGLKGGLLVGLILGLLNIVPFLGTLIGLIVVLPLAYLQPNGSLQLLGLALIVFTVVQLIESWFLTPKIMANRSGLHPALVVISVFFWGKAFGGITGMVLAVPLTAFLIAAWAHAKDGLTRSLQSEHEAGRVMTPDSLKTPAGDEAPNHTDDQV